MLQQVTEIFMKSWLFICLSHTFFFFISFRDSPLWPFTWSVLFKLLTLAQCLQAKKCPLNAPRVYCYIWDKMLAYRVYMEGSVFQISNGQDDTLYKVRKREASLQDGGEGVRKMPWGWREVCLKGNSSCVEKLMNMLTGLSQQERWEWGRGEHGGLLKN